jgi:O-antigen ligase
VTGYAEQLTNRWLPLGMAGGALFLGLLAGIEPKLAIGAAFGIGFVALTLLNLTAGVCLFAMLTFVDEVLPSGGFSLTKLMGMLLIVSWLAGLTVGENRHRKLFGSPGLLYLLVVFIVWVGLSATWAELPADSIGAVMRYAPNALLLLIVYAAVRTRDDAIAIVGAYVLGTLMSAAYGVVVPVDADPEGRLSGALGNANETATALAIGIALAAALVVALRGRPWLRAGAAIGIPFCLLALFLTVSRGGLVAFGAVLIASVAMAGRRRTLAIGLVLATVLGAVGYFAVVAPPEARDRIVQSDGGTGREDIWKVGWRMVEAHPVNGIGAGNFASQSVHYLLEPGAIKRADFIVDDPKVAHNTYLEILAELGVVGLVLFLSILGCVLLIALKAVRTFAEAGDHALDIVSRAVFVALIGFLTAAFFGSREFSNQLWLLLSLPPALLGLARAELAEKLGREALAQRDGSATGEAAYARPAGA